MDRVGYPVGAGARLRLPDFVILGAMKAGTTSVYSWLAVHPEVSLIPTKEPHFFSRDDVWERGLAWYGGLYTTVGPGRITGDSSVSYTSPDHCDAAARRMRSVLPDAKLVFISREPSSRLRSHYSHEYRRTRERRSLAEALEDRSSIYLRQSLYGRCLAPYFELFNPRQILILDLESLAPHREGWPRLLSHLGLSDASQGPVQNVVAQKSQFTRPMLWLHDHNLTSRFSRLPQPARRFGRRILLRRSHEYLQTLETARTTPLPPWAIDELRGDRELFQSLVNSSASPWKISW